MLRSMVILLFCLSLSTSVWAQGGSYELEDQFLLIGDSQVIYPQIQGFSSPAVEDRMNEYLKEKAREYRVQVEKKKLKDVQYRGAWTGEEFLSIVFSGMDREHQETFTDSVTFDLRDGTVLDLTSLIPEEVFLGDEFFDFINDLPRNVGKTEPFSMGPHVQYYFYRHFHTHQFFIEFYFIREEPIRTPVYIRSPVAALTPFLDPQILPRLQDKF